MKLNHLNLTVSNVLETHRFLEKHFGMKLLGRQPSEAMGFITDDNGLVLSLSRGARGVEVKCPGWTSTEHSRRISIARSSSERVAGTRRTAYHPPSTSRREQDCWREIWLSSSARFAQTRAISCGWIFLLCASSTLAASCTGALRDKYVSAMTSRRSIAVRARASGP